MTVEVTIVGGGIVGLATAHRLLAAKPNLKLLLLEKEPRLAAHQTGNNSGVLHSGLYYKPGSAKAQCAVQGLQQMLAFCRTHGIAHEQCGKIVVATTPEEVAALGPALGTRPRQRPAGPAPAQSAQIKEIEPHAAGLAAIHVPQEGIVDYPAVCARLGELIRQAGGEIRLQARLQAHHPMRHRLEPGHHHRPARGEICRHLRRLARRPAGTRLRPETGGNDRSLSRRVLPDQTGTRNFWCGI